jgi:hypothetical protein
MPASIAKLNGILDFYFGGQTGATGAATPDPMYFGLSTTEVDEYDWSSVTEPGTSGDSYGRVEFGNTASNWALAQTGATYNISPIVFPTSTLSWGGTGAPILSLFITDEDYPTDGNVIWYMTLDPPMAIDVNMAVTYQTGCINIYCY